MTYLTYVQSPLGTLTLGSDGQALTLLSLREIPPVEGQIFKDDLPLWPPIRDWLNHYWQGTDPGRFPVPLRPAGTPFQEKVWQLLLEIPYGKTVTYGDLARALDCGRMSPQAVGGAVGRNPIAIVIPCHRVVGTGGRITGYAYGLEAKKKLLILENAPFST